MSEDSNLRPRIEAFLDIRGFGVLPSSISQTLGINPDEAWSEGEVIQGTTRRRLYSCWKIRASLSEYSYDVDDYVNDIVAKISPVADKMKRIKGANLMLCIWVTIHASGRTPSVTFRPKVMRMLSDIGAEIDVDISVVPDEGGQVTGHGD